VRDGAIETQSMEERRPLREVRDRSSLVDEPRRRGALCHRALNLAPERAKTQHLGPSMSGMTLMAVPRRCTTY